MAQFRLLDQVAEDKLHSTRLLNIEERPFKRITKRLLAPTTPIATYLTRTPTGQSDPSIPAQDDTNDKVNDDDQPPKTTTSSPPPPPSTQSTSITSTDATKYQHDLQRFRADTMLDFSAFDSSIARIQFLYNANEKQRGAYADEKVRIQSTSDAVRSDTDRLKVRLEEAQKTLAVRKGYDVLAEKITRNRDLRSRDEQAVNIGRLRNEIEELEREGVELGNAWEERRDQFARLVEEGGRLRRVVRGEPEPEPDAGRGDGDGDSDGNGEGEGGRRNELDGEGEHDGDGDGDGDGDRERDENMLGILDDHDRNSDMGTPRPTRDGEDAPTPLPNLHESGVMTPRSIMADVEVSTPRPDEKSTLGDTDAGADTEMKEDVIPSIKVDDMDTT